ncbi:antitrypsin-like isoform X2 [Formica exsecta]|uniref:antitrypsin-like isoform X1 n=1 Tax=Formica exsecta TaxID=72781 RepID=UPI001144CBCC|nr:antitrypsin-like isoform X1 [Formica exsecta]XP_029667208.1 antitrypsin-like isoform X2 [Formica exsecta]
MFSSKTFAKKIFANLSTAIITYVELKDVSSLKEPSYINQWINKDDMENKVYTTKINMIMSLLLNGVKEGSTESELMSFLKITDKISLNNRYLSELTYSNNVYNNIELHLKTAVYVQNSIELTADFSSICIDNFYCSISKIDFRNKVHAAETINSWIQETTNNKILDVISPVNIDEDTKIMLVNTAYLNSRWLDLTYKGKTEERKFHVSPSESYLVPTIKFKKSTFFHGEILHWNAKFIEIPFLDSSVTMTILLPNEEVEPGNLGYLKKKFNFAEFQLFRTTYTFEQATVLYLPKFTSEYTRNITDFFRQKGVITMFEDNADFTRLSKIPLKVNNIFQTISMKINKGSSDAPYVIKKNTVRKPVGTPWELIVDRPFLYIIEVYGEMMFFGTVQTPDFMFMKDEL